MSIKLTKKQTLIIEFISSFTEVKGYSPSYREIMDAIGIKSVSAVAEHINNLVAKGALKKSPGSARSLEVIDTTYPETVALFKAKLNLCEPEQAEILEKAAEILDLDLTDN